ncbi:hypothetical protein V8C40DRAFT_225967 [Trichoderma camerunense]
MTADAAEKKKSQENSARRKQVRRCSALLVSGQVLVSSSPRHAGLVNWGVRAPERDKITTAGRKKGLSPAFAPPSGRREREYWFRIGPEPAAWQSLCEACMGLGRDQHQPPSNAMQLLRTAGFKGVLQTLVLFSASYCM